MKEVLLYLFKTLEDNGIEYLILNNYKSLPEYNEGNDIDFVVKPEDMHIIHSVVEQMALLFDISIVRYVKRQYSTQYYFVGKGEFSNLKLHIDFLPGVDWRGATYLSAQRMLRKKRKYKMFYVPSIEHEVLYAWFRSFLWGGFIKEKYKNFILENYKNIKSELERLLGYKLTNKLLNLIEQERIEDTTSYLTIIRTKVWLYSFKRSPFKTTKNAILSYFLDNLIKFKKTGLFIVLLGPDGAGKSSVAEKIIEENEIFNKASSVIYHWRPGFLPPINQLFFKKTDSYNEVFSKPHTNKIPHNYLVSFLRFLYYFIDFHVGYWLKVHPRLRKGGLVIFDRYYYDYMVDLKRFRLKIPNLILNIFMKLVPRPDLVIFLENTPENIYKRKQEIDINEIKRQIQEFNNITKKLINGRKINTNKPIEAVAVAVLDEIYIKLKDKWGLR